MPHCSAPHQVAFQIWLATSLLADALAIACQTLLARAAAANDLPLARALATSAIWLSLMLGCGLAAGLYTASTRAAALFSADAGVVALVTALMPIVAGSQLLNSLAFTLDGVLYGAGGFRYAAAQMVVCAGPSLAVMFAGQPSKPAAGALLQLSAQLGGLEAPLSAAVNVSMLGDSREGLTAAASSGSLMGVAGGAWGAAARGFVQRASLQGPSSSAFYAGGSDAATATAGGSVGWGGGGGLYAVSLQQPAEASLPALLWVWAGLCCLMALRAATILLPLACRCARRLAWEHARSL